MFRHQLDGGRWYGCVSRMRADAADEYDTAAAQCTGLGYGYDAFVIQKTYEPVHQAILATREVILDLDRQ